MTFGAVSLYAEIRSASDIPVSSSYLGATGVTSRAIAMLHLPQHPDEHRPKRPVVLAIDQEFGEGAALRVAPELTDLGVNNRRGDARRVLSPW
jgi:hypothetical protein